MNNTERKIELLVNLTNGGASFTIDGTSFKTGWAPDVMQDMLNMDLESELTNITISSLDEELDQKLSQSERECVCRIIKQIKDEK